MGSNTTEAHPIIGNRMKKSSESWDQNYRGRPS